MNLDQFPFFSHTRPVTVQNTTCVLLAIYENQKRPAPVADTFFAFRGCTLRRDSIPILPDWPAQFPKLFFLKPKLNINAVF